MRLEGVCVGDRVRSQRRRQVGAETQVDREHVLSIASRLTKIPIQIHIM